MNDKLTEKAEKLYACIKKKGGGAIEEWWLRDQTGLSHGSFCAARKELVAAGLLVLGKDIRKTTYEVRNLTGKTGAEDALTCQKEERAVLTSQPCDGAAHTCQKQHLPETAQAAGCEVKLLQSHNLAGESPGYPCVCDEANAWAADVFLSIHVNAGGGRGAETYCYNLGGKGERLAHCIQDQLIAAIQPIDPGYCDRGVYEHPTFCVLRNTNMPAVLVEVGFIDSDDVGVLTLHGDEIARALARGVTDYGQSLKS